MIERIAPAMHFPRRRAGAAGFSLIEVLISMVLALITFLVMFQMFESWDRNKRSTASGGGAMISGALAMFRLERDLRLAGFGFGNASELGCCVTAYDSTRTVESLECAPTGTPSPQRFSFPLAPLQIVDGGAGGAPDQIVTLYGSSEGISATRFFGTSAAGAQPYTAATSTSTQMEIGARGGIQQGDLVVLAYAGGCKLAEVTDTSSGDRRTFAHIDTGTNYCNFYTDQLACATSTSPRRYNDATVIPGPTGNVYVLGPRPQRRIWQIRNNRTLAFSNGLGGGTGVNPAVDTHGDLIDVADNIINLQAEYIFAGTAPAACTASATWRTDTPAASCQAFIWAVRVGLLTRSDQYEKTPVTTIAPLWAGGAFGMTNVDGTADSLAARDTPNDWRHYRYRVFESIIPLKNVMWGSR